MESNQQPQLWDSRFRGINLDQWIDMSQKTVAVNVTQSERMFTIAMDYFEAQMYRYWKNKPEYQVGVKAKEQELKLSRLSEPEQARQLSLYKLMQLIELLDEKSVKEVDKVIDPILAWKLREEDKNGGGTSTPGL